jgi:phage shock protein C
MTETHKKLYRSKKEHIIAGVCGGLGEYLDVDPVLIRIGFVLLALGHGFGVLLYIILMIIIPKESAKGEDQEAKINIKASAQEMKEIAQDLGKEVRSAAEEFKDHKGWFSDRRNIVGMVLIILGFIALTNMAFPVQMFWFRWNYLWPVIIILIGIFLIVKQKK